MIVLRDEEDWEEGLNSDGYFTNRITKRNLRINDPSSPHDNHSERMHARAICGTKCNIIHQEITINREQKGYLKKSKK